MEPQVSLQSLTQNRADGRKSVRTSGHLWARRSGDMADLPHASAPTPFPGNHAPGVASDRLLMALSQGVAEGTISVRAATAAQNKFEINVPEGIDKTGVIWFHRYR